MKPEDKRKAGEGDKDRKDGKRVSSYTYTCTHSKHIDKIICVFIPATCSSFKLEQYGS